MGNRLGEFVKERRKALGLSQRKLADKAKISHSVINKIENGDNIVPRTQTLEALSFVLGVSVTKLMDELQGKPAKASGDPLLTIIEKLSPKKRKLLLDIAELLLEYTG